MRVRKPISFATCLALPAALALATSCSDRPGREVLEPEMGDPPLASISDAVHSSGNIHFFWLPPIVGAPATFNGPFDDSQSPLVRVCLLSACPTPIVEYTRTSGMGSEILRVSLENEHYIVSLHTDEVGLVPGEVYRISVLVAGAELGFADFQLAETGHEAKNLSTGDLIGLKDGRTLAVKFRLEAGAVFPITPDGGTVVALGGVVTMEFPDGALAEETGITVQPVVPTDALVEAEFGPDGTQFLAPVLVTMAYSEDDLDGIDEADLGLTIRDELDRWITPPGSEVFPDLDEVRAPFFHFSPRSASSMPSRSSSL